METLSGKAVIVTGGTRGIGRAIAERLLREGARVAICGRSGQSVERAVEEMKPLGAIFGHAADVTQVDQVRKFFRQTDKDFSGALDVLVNNAGAGVFKKVGEMTPEEWHANIDLDLNGPFYCSREALARFGARGGFIVNISSLAGKNAFSGGAAYNAAKAGLNRFSEAMMLDHRYDNVRVSYLMPGSVDTEFAGDPSKRAGDTSWMIAAEDVAEVVLMVLRMPARSMVSRVEMRPSRPKK
jgi:NAD(P)-dependent dehydrogenase (short-subunit alcohol dehydrogenase family)